MLFFHPKIESATKKTKRAVSSRRPGCFADVANGFADQASIQFVEAIVEAGNDVFLL